MQRSLQLSERSPNRSSLLQKLAVRIGNTVTPQQAAAAKYREKAAADYTHSRSKTSLNMPTPAKYNAASLRNSDNSLPSSSAQAKSFEMLDFNGKLSVDYGFESDSKSKSFDDDFCYNTKLARIGNSGGSNTSSTQNSNSTRNIFSSGNRAFSQDRVLLVPPTSSASKSLRNSPRNYGSRLYDHDALYDTAQQRSAATRSPLMNFRGPLNPPPLSRERSPVGGRRTRDRERDYKKHSNNNLNNNNNNNTSSSNSSNTNNYLKPRQTTTPNRSPNRSPSDSDDSINEKVNKVLKDKSLVAEYLFGLKRKQQTNRSGTSSGRY